MHRDLPGILSNWNSQMMTTNVAPAPFSAEQFEANVKAIMADYKAGKTFNYPPDLYPIPMDEYERRFGHGGA